MLFFILQYVSFTFIVSVAHYAKCPSWSENWTVYQSISLARSWLFLAVRVGKHNFSTHHHHRQVSNKKPYSPEPNYQFLLQFYLVQLDRLCNLIREYFNYEFFSIPLLFSTDVGLEVLWLCPYYSAMLLCCLVFSIFGVLLQGGQSGVTNYRNGPQRATTHRNGVRLWLILCVSYIYPLSRRRVLIDRQIESTSIAVHCSY